MIPLRFGILGTGRILAKLGPAFRHSAKTQLVAIASRDLARARATAAQHDAVRAHGSYDALLADPEIDVVYNALHNGLHCEWTVRALAAGKHVLCEKPLACSSAEVAQMFAAAHAHRRWLMEAFMYRFQPQIAAAKQCVDDGEIGQLLHIRACYATRGRDPDNPRYWPAAGGGALMDVGCYCVNAALLFAGGEPTRIGAQAHFAPGTGVDLTLAGTLGFAGGLTAHLLCSFESEGVYGIELTGTDGKLVIPNPWLPAGDCGEFVLTRGGRAETRRQPTSHQLSHFTAEIDHFADCVRENRAPTFPPGADAERASRATMRVLDALLESARAAVAEKR
jgi:predicted dehydrogenase